MTDNIVSAAEALEKARKKLINDVLDKINYAAVRGSTSMNVPPYFELELLALPSTQKILTDKGYTLSITQKDQTVTSIHISWLKSNEKEEALVEKVRAMVEAKIVEGSSCVILHRDYWDLELLLSPKVRSVIEVGVYHMFAVKRGNEIESVVIGWK